MLFEVSYINKQGDIETNKHTICGEEFESMIYAMKYRKKKTFIYDATDKRKEYVNDVTFLSQNSVHSNNSHNFNPQNFNQNLFGRNSNMNYWRDNSNYNNEDYICEDGRYMSM